MSDEKPPVEFCKGVNGLDKVVLREVRGSSVEVRFVSSYPALDRLFFSFFRVFLRILDGTRYLFSHRNFDWFLIR